eukprot:g7222.t1
MPGPAPGIPGAPCIIPPCWAIIGFIAAFIRAFLVSTVSAYTSSICSEVRFENCRDLVIIFIAMVSHPQSTLGAPTHCTRGHPVCECIGCIECIGCSESSGCGLHSMHSRPHPLLSLHPMHPMHSRRECRTG